MLDKKLITATFASALVFSTSTIGAREGESAKEKAVEYRHGVMEVFSWNLSAMGSMVKGETPYEKAVFERHARDLANAAQLDLLSGFPEDSVTDESDAKDEIWLNWKEFTEKFQNLQTQSAKLVEVSASGDMEKIKPQFKEAADACKGCHREFKQ